MNSRKFFYDFGKALYHVDAFYDEFDKQSNVSSALLWVLYFVPLLQSDASSYIIEPTRRMPQLLL